MEQQLINRIVEAALLAASQPLTVVQLRGLFPLDEPAPEGGVEKALEALQQDCAARGIELVEVASGWRFQVKGDVHPWVARLWTERQTKYTRATLETLALIAYRQPITRGEIEQVRGVAVNSNIIKALEEREWIRVVGHRDIPGRPELLGTTKAFLDYFGLKRLDELPPLSELKDFGELEPELKLDRDPSADGAMPVGDIAGGQDATGADAQDDAHDGSGDTAATAAGEPDANDPAPPSGDEPPTTTDAASAADIADAGIDIGIDTGNEASATDLTPSDEGHEDPTHDTALADDGDSERSTR